MNKNTGTVQASPQEQALAQIGAARFEDYQARWLPVQQHLGSVVADMGKEGSWQREEAKGKGNVDAAEAFAKTEQQTEARRMASGINVGSSAFKLGVTGSAIDEARAKGAGINSGNQQIDRAYLSGLSTMMQLGRGQSATAASGLAISGELGSREAITAAQESAAERAGNYELAGYGIGLGTGLMAGQPSAKGTMPGGLPANALP
jgi:hypothetical protein